MASHAIAVRAPEPESDDGLMVRVMRRDALAFRAVVDAHATRLHRIAYRMIGDATEAEDLSQEALMRLWQHAARWQARGAGDCRMADARGDEFMSGPATQTTVQQ